MAQILQLAGDSLEKLNSAQGNRAESRGNLLHKENNKWTGICFGRGVSP